MICEKLSATLYEEKMTVLLPEVFQLFPKLPAMLNNKSSSDITIVVKDDEDDSTEELYLHKIILSLSCEYFAGAFRMHPNTNSYTVSGNKKGIVSLLKWIYTGVLESDDLLDIVIAGDFLQLNSISYILGIFYGLVNDADILRLLTGTNPLFLRLIREAPKFAAPRANGCFINNIIEISKKIHIREEIFMTIVDTYCNSDNREPRGGPMTVFIIPQNMVKFMNDYVAATGIQYPKWKGVVVCNRTFLGDYYSRDLTEVSTVSIPKSTKLKLLTNEHINYHYPGIPDDEVTLEMIHCPKKTILLDKEKYQQWRGPEGFTGGHVMPLPSLDFHSLYPSSMTDSIAKPTPPLVRYPFSLPSVFDSSDSDSDSDSDSEENNEKESDNKEENNEN